MRFDTPVYFQKITPGAYDAVSGDYGPNGVVEEKRLAAVTDTGIETLNLLYGEIKQGVVTVRLQNHYSKLFDRIRIGEKIYRCDRARPLRLKYTLICSEVQQHG